MVKQVHNRPEQPSSPAGQWPESARGAAKHPTIRVSKAPQRGSPVRMSTLPPTPPLRGITRVFALCFGPLQPLRFFWAIARWLWLIAGLLVIGAVGVAYLVNLFTGSVPTASESFFDSPLLEFPAIHPLRFMAGAGVVLFITLLTWGAAREHQRRLNARAERVRQAIRVGLTTDLIDKEMRAALLAGDLYGNFQIATEVHEQDRIADAIWLYQLILEKAPKHFGANYNLGLIHAETEQFDDAEGYCRTAILLNAESAEAQGLTAYVLYRLDLLEEAQRRARLAVRMGFSSQMLESLILPGLGTTSTLPAVGANKDPW